MTAHPLPSSYLQPPKGDPLDQFNPGYLDEIANAIRGPAVQAAIDMRIEQIVRYGHDSEHDDMQPLFHLPRQARERLIAAIEQIEGTGEKRQLPAARKNLARVAAMCMAAIDRLDRATVAEAKQRELGL
jgi:hypothetical protein